MPRHRPDSTEDESAPHLKSVALDDHEHGEPGVNGVNESHAQKEEESRPKPEAQPGALLSTGDDDGEKKPRRGRQF